MKQNKINEFIAKLNENQTIWNAITRRNNISIIAQKVTFIVLNKMFCKFTEMTLQPQLCFLR